MELHNRSLRVEFWLLIALAAVIGLSILTACGTVTGAGNQEIYPTFTPECYPGKGCVTWPPPGCGVVGEPPCPGPTSTLPEGFPNQATEVAYETRVAEGVAQQATWAALSPQPTITTWVNRPTPPPRFGRISPPSMQEDYQAKPFYLEGWRGYVNGEILTTAVGRQAETVDLNQGIITVFQGILFDEQAPTTHTYLTPQRLGIVHLVDVDGTLVKLGLGTDPGDPGFTNDVVFVFDLATRQWVLLTPGPSPSPGQSPRPSPSAGPSATP